MMWIIELVLLLALMMLSIPVTVLLVQVILAARFRQANNNVATAGRPTVALLVPAYNEEAGIGKTLASIQSQMAEGDRLVVVADNCTDSTADIARRYGAEVCERTDHQQRGKAYALDCGLRFISQNPREVVIIVDADCEIGEGSIDLLGRTAIMTGRPAQALYMMYSDKKDNLSLRIAEFAWLVKNHVRPLGYHGAGFPCQLMGTGMAFPWPLIESASVSNDHLAEDMKLGVELAMSGHPPIFCPDAKVTSYFPTTAEGLKVQRTRWEHGHMSMIASELPRMLLLSMKTADWRLLALALDLMIPPLALLVLITGTVFMLSASVFVLGGAMLPFVVAGVIVLALAASILLAWRLFGKAVISPADLLLALFYASCKIPLYVRYFVAKQKAWIRTERK